MSDGVDFKLFAEPFFKFLDDRQVRMRRTAMWTVREGGRFLGKEARRRAPVLKDTSQASYAQVRKGAKFRAGGGIGPIQGEGVWSTNRPIPGLLRASIKPSRRLHEAGGVYSLKVGPRGQRVHLYAGKIEAKEPYMQPAYEETVAAMQAIAERAYSRVWKE